MPQYKMSELTNEKLQLNIRKQLTLSVLLQLVFLASLIVGSWINLQDQLSQLRQNISQMLEAQKNDRKKFEQLDKLHIYCDYRLGNIEKKLYNTELNLQGEKR